MNKYNVPFCDSDKHQVDHGQTGSLSFLSLFDYEHEHRDAEHEHDNCVGMPERPAQPGRTRKICHVRAGGVRLRFTRLFASDSACHAVIAIGN